MMHLKITHGIPEANLKDYLCLRLHAQQSMGRAHNLQYHDMLDEFDDLYDHLQLFQDGNLVGEGRIRIHNHANAPCEHPMLSSGYLAEQHIAEASRFGVIPSQQGHGIFKALAYCCFQYALSKDVETIIANCEKKLLPIYDHLGSKPLGLTFHSKFMGKLDLHMFYFSKKTMQNATQERRSEYEKIFTGPHISL